MSESVSRREKVRTIARMARYRPLFTAGIIVFSVGTTLLEGIGLSFILPIVELLQETDDPTAEADGLMLFFVRAYSILGLPFTLEFVILGVASAMFLRYMASFGVSWLTEILTVEYVRDIQTEAFGEALDARVKYFDREGSDTILNAIITQTGYAGSVMYQFVSFFQNVLLSSMYLAISLYLAPVLTLAACVVLGGITYFLRRVIEPAYDIGDRVAEANERVQTQVQRGTQGIRDVKLFHMNDEVFQGFEQAVADHAHQEIALGRNHALINSVHQLLSAVVIFALIYVGYRVSSLSLGALGVFLFAMFRLAPKVSKLTTQAYQIEGSLPHLVRTYEFVEELTESQEPNSEREPIPNVIDSLAFRDVTFSYPTGERALENVSFRVERGEFIGFIGRSGAGKSTIVSLIARLYDPASGAITANGTPITAFPVRDWRSKIAVVRQDPFIFDETLRYNLTIGNRDVSESAIHRACEVARVTEFLGDLPNGYETRVGDKGVKLSGGQRQRIAIARALLKDAEILVLDEATSELDSDIERQVHTGIESMQREYTIIAVAHRLSTVTGADRIHTVDDGRIVQTGSHQELIERDGIYSDLYALQS